jgi:hypothetical protein
MEGNDLGSYWTQKIVVIAEPTLFIPPPDSYRFSLGKHRYGKKDAAAAEFELNRLMLSFIVNMGRTRNVPTEIWTFITDEDVVEELARRLEQVAGNTIVGWEIWDDERDAVLNLRVDASIHTVYDAEAERVETLWGLRGHRVQRGKAPTS